MGFSLSRFYPLLASAFILASCNPYKAVGARGQVGNAGAASQNVSPAALTNVSVVIANNKLASLGGELKARITYEKQSATQTFNPSGLRSELKDIRLPMGSSGIMTVEILQGDALKFIAKRAKTSVQSGGTVIIDDCLILRAPWAGTVNDGSCEWDVTEVSN